MSLDLLTGSLTYSNSELEANARSLRIIPNVSAKRVKARVFLFYASARAVQPHSPIVVHTM